MKVGNCPICLVQLRDRPGKGSGAHGWAHDAEAQGSRWLARAQPASTPKPAKRVGAQRRALMPVSTGLSLSADGAYEAGRQVVDR